MYYLRILLTIINLGLFGVGSFLCFIVAVSQSVDRLLIGGIFLLLLTFANQKIISKFFSSNDWKPMYRSMYCDWQ